LLSMRQPVRSSLGSLTPGHTPERLTRSGRNER
jgi:hypothetical protein